jgi:hypothetical protein
VYAASAFFAGLKGDKVEWFKSLKVSKFHYRFDVSLVSSLKSLSVLSLIRFDMGNDLKI